MRRVKQQAAAEIFGVTQATISRWESGAQAPTPRQAERLRGLLAASPDGAADRALAELVRGAAEEVHLVCDVTHRLLAASPARERRWRLSARDLAGASMWSYASAEIMAAEAGLTDLGWFEPNAGMVEFSTGRNRSRDVPIRRGGVRWTRMRLSDGSYARLVQARAE